jgi:hypothetical protein
MSMKSVAPAALALALAVLPAVAQTVYYVDVAPPAPVAETMPAPREGYVWAPGYYTLRGNEYVWVAGHWIQARPGYRYVSPRWIEDHGRWRYTDEQWVQDEDHQYGRNAVPGNRGE